MTFDEFWKQSGWGKHGAEMYEGTSEYSLAQDAYNAGQQAVRAEVAAALEELQGNLIADAQAEATWGSGTNENTINRHFKLIITKLGLASGKEGANG